MLSFRTSVLQGREHVSRSEFIASYVRRCESVGFAVRATETGCVYLADGAEQETDTPMVAMPCECGCAEGWGMLEIGGSA
jgi:hypothetical protein